MPSLRFSRDKRGYEYVYLVHTPVRRGRPGRQRLLYWYRTPPGVAIGRKPFDEGVQRTLERQYPGISFDWNLIVSTPMPPPDLTEYRRERRRAERAAKQERRAAEAVESVESTAVPPEPVEPGASDELETADPLALVIIEETSGDASPRLQVVEAEPVSSTETGGEGPPGDQAGSSRRRRRRGRRRRGAPNDPSVVAASAQEPSNGAQEGVDADDGEAEAEDR